MRTEPFGAELTERYFRSRGLQHFRGQHDSEYFFILKTAFGPLHVHLDTSQADGESLTIQVTPDRFFAAADRRRLMRLAKRWNRRGGPAEAAAYNSIDLNRIGVAAKGSVPINPNVQFDQFAAVLDHTIASAAEFFSELCSFVEPPLAHSQEVLLPDAS
jgi:hypothetical protein